MMHPVRIVTVAALGSMLALVLVTVMPAFAVIHHIPTDFTTIQAGLNASATGDTVLVQPGTYYENITWPQVNGIKLIAAGDSSNTIIDGGSQLNRVITMASEGLIDTTTVIQRFTLCNGLAYEGSGGGIYCYQSDAVIESCNFVNNYADGLYNPRGSGGGVCCQESSPVIRNCSFYSNRAETIGGGICCQYNANPAISDCIFVENGAFTGGGIGCYTDSDPAILGCSLVDNSSGNGGGLSCYINCNPTVDSCVISDNSVSEGIGGGVFCFESTPEIVNSQITGNFGGEGGGGVYCHTASPVLRGCQVSENWVGGYTGGGGIECHWNSNPLIVDCLICNNSANLSGGGGISCRGGSNPTIDHCVIMGNQVEQWGNEGHGGGITIIHCSPVIRNCTITNNSANLGSGIYGYGEDFNSSISNCCITDNSGEGLHLAWGAAPDIAFNVFHDNSDGDVRGEIGTELGLIVGTNVIGDPCDVYNNIFLDPRYVDAENGDYHLNWNSPCIDAGDPDSPQDSDGTIADIGAFYYDQSVGVREGWLADESELPARWTMRPAYPNPFNAATTITLALPQSAELNVTVFNMIGQQVATLASGNQAAGLHTLTFDASDLASGVYFIRAAMKPGSEIHPDNGKATSHTTLDQTQKVLLLR